MDNAVIAELQKLADLGVGPFVHPRRVAVLIGCSHAHLVKAMDEGVIPVVRPFARGIGNERPTRYIDMLRWIEQARSHRSH